MFVWCKLKNGGKNKRNVIEFVITSLEESYRFSAVFNPEQIE